MTNDEFDIPKRGVSIVNRDPPLSVLCLPGVALRSLGEGGAKPGDLCGSISSSSFPGKTGTKLGKNPTKLVPILENPREL